MGGLMGPRSSAGDLMRKKRQRRLNLECLFGCQTTAESTKDCAIWMYSIVLFMGAVQIWHHRLLFSSVRCGVSAIGVSAIMKLFALRVFRARHTAWRRLWKWFHPADWQRSVLRNIFSSARCADQQCVGGEWNKHNKKYSFCAFCIKKENLFLMFCKR